MGPEIKVEIEYDIKDTAAFIKDTKIVDNSLNNSPVTLQAPYYDRIRKEAYGLDAYDESGIDLRHKTIEEDGITYLVLEPADGLDHFLIPARTRKEYVVKYCVPNYLTKSGNTWYFSNHYGHTVQYADHSNIGRVEKKAVYRIPLGWWYWLNSYEVKVAPAKERRPTVGGASIVIEYGFAIALNESEYNTVVIVVSKAKWLQYIGLVGLFALGWIAERVLPAVIKWLSGLL
ncbi:MAG: hypothetical protein KAW89_08805 [Armatimonadetes bacterium]|nr:hypothetical protein [Armatimonadota bacterium]